MGAVARARCTYYLLHRRKSTAVTFERGATTMSDFKSFKLNDGGSVPTIAFGTGTSFFNRNDDVADAVVKGIKVGLDFFPRWPVYNDLKGLLLFQAGYKLIDTAIMYGTEKGVGIGIKRALSEGLIKREDLVVTTKLPPYDQSIEKVFRKEVLRAIKAIFVARKLLTLRRMFSYLVH